MNPNIVTNDEHSNEPKWINILILCRGVGVVDRGAERATKDLATALSAHCNSTILAYGKSESVVTIRQGANYGLKLAWGRSQQISYLAWDMGPHSEQAVTESFLGLFESLVRK